MNRPTTSSAMRRLQRTGLASGFSRKIVGWHVQRRQWSAANGGSDVLPHKKKEIGLCT